MLKTIINGQNCILYYDERVAFENSPYGYPYGYHIRHSEEEWTCPESIEPFVLANFFGTVFMKKPIEFRGNCYIDIEDFKIEGNYQKFFISKNTLNLVFGSKKK
jgi:hypothetical protein